MTAWWADVLVEGCLTFKFSGVIRSTNEHDGDLILGLGCGCDRPGWSLNPAMPKFSALPVSALSSATTRLRYVVPLLSPSWTNGLSHRGDDPSPILQVGSDPRDVPMDEQNPNLVRGGRFWVFVG